MTPVLHTSAQFLEHLYWYDWPWLGSFSHPFRANPAMLQILCQKVSQNQLPRSPAPGEGLHAASNSDREAVRFRNSSAVFGSFGTWMLSTKKTKKSPPFTIPNSTPPASSCCKVQFTSSFCSVFSNECKLNWRSKSAAPCSCNFFQIR